MFDIRFTHVVVEENVMITRQVCLVGKTCSRLYFSCLMHLLNLFNMDRILLEFVKIFGMLPREKGYHILSRIDCLKMVLLS